MFSKLVKKENSDSVPLSIFNNKKLGILELVVKYLKENKDLKFSEIAKLLQRNQRTIWTTYSKSKKKYPSKLIIKESLEIPLNIFEDRRKGPLTTLCLFLKGNVKMSYKEIAIALDRNYRTVWTVCNK